MDSAEVRVVFAGTSFWREQRLASGTDRDDARPSGTDAGGGEKAEREVEGLRDRLGGSCGIRDDDVSDSLGTANAKLPMTSFGFGNYRKRRKSGPTVSS